MDIEHKPQRGRPPLGRTRMVTIGIRVEPTEREQLEELAAQQGKSLCGFLRDLIRGEIIKDGEIIEDDERLEPLRACN